MADADVYWNGYDDGWKWLTLFTAPLYLDFTEWDTWWRGYNQGWSDRVNGIQR